MAIEMKSKIKISGDPFRIGEEIESDTDSPYAKYNKVVDDGSIAAAGLLLGEANRTRYTELAPPKFKVGDRVLVATKNTSSAGVVTEHDTRAWRRGAPFTVRLDKGGEFYFDEPSLSLEPTPRPFQVGDKVRVKEASSWRTSFSGPFTVRHVNAEAFFESSPGVHSICVDSIPKGRLTKYFRPSDLELVTAAEEVAPVSWRGVPFDRVDYTRALKIDHGTSHSYAPKQRIRIKRSDKMEAFHGVEGSVVSVDPDGTYHCQLDGDSYTRETYRFRENELEAVAPKEAPKKVRRNPVPKFAPLKYDPGAMSYVNLAVTLFRSDPRVCAFINHVSDHALNARKQGCVTVFDDQDQDRVERAVRVAWDRDESGWRSECEQTAERMERERRASR